MPAALDDRRKKLHFRAWRRGFREIDLILGRFADAHLAGLDEAALDEFEALLGVPDQIAYAWILGQEAPAAAHDTATLARIRRFHQIENDL
ncbi:MAG: succinate dehydrogenase assembly factor 2 [Hydrogenophilaceae bacterium]|jgi:antitoxin CptB|nr:succinate dehydrogenase assembly factor 2 [Hydrogenophilaceae bacterium]